MSSASSSSPIAVSRAAVLLSTPPDRPGPRVAPSEAELLIDPQFYSFLSGVAIVLVLLSFSFCIAYMLLSTIRRRQYRKYRQRRRLEDERDKLVYSATPPSHALQQPLRTPEPPPPPPVFVPRLQYLSSAPLSSVYALPTRGSLPSFLAPFSAVLSRDGSLPVIAAGSAATLPRAQLSFASPSSFASSVSSHSRSLWSMLTPRRRRTAADPTAAASSVTHSVSPFPFCQSPNGRSPVTSSVSSPAVPSRSSLSKAAPLYNEARQRRDSLQPPPPLVSRQAHADPPPARSSTIVAATSARVLASSHQEEVDAQQYEHNRGFLSFSLSTFLLTIALLWLSLIPLTLALHSSLTTHYLLSWLTPHLVSSLWTLTTFLSTLSLFVVAPFAYLYYEAEGLFFLPLPTFLPSLSVAHSHDDDDGYTFLPRFMETALILFCFSVMLYGSFHLVHCLMYGLPIVSFTWSKLLSLSFVQLLTPSALFSNVLHFLPGLFICLSQCHAGFSALLSSSFSLRVPFYYNHYLRQQLDFIGVKLNHARLLLPATTSLSRRLVLANRIQSLEQHSADINKKLHPPLLSLSYFPVLRNAVWFVTTLVCLLLIWHIVVRVMQREARLMVGSLEAMVSDSDGEQRGVVMSAVGLLLAVLKWLLRGMKNGVNTLLSMVGMIRRVDTHTSTAAASEAHDDTSASILSVGFLLQLWSDALRLLSSFLLGHNGFKHPFTHLLFDLLIVNFFCWSCAIGLYRMPWMAQYSPFSSFAAKASAAFDLDEGKEKGPEAVVGNMEQSSDESRAVHQLAATSSSPFSGRLLPIAAPSAAASMLPSSSASMSALTSPSALYSAQFFVVNTTVVLLVVSSFPFAVWLLGLSSFPLTNFYPAASELTAGPFVHCYNLAFITLSAGQMFSLWSRLLWYLVNTFYRSTYALLTWILPSLHTTLPSPHSVSALPATVRAHPYAVRLSFLCSTAGLRWAVRAIVLPLLYLLLLLFLYLLRVLAVGLKLCARGFYVKVVRFINAEMDDPALPSLGRQHSRQQLQHNNIQEADNNELPPAGEMSRMRTLDEERTFTPAAAAITAKEHGLTNGRHELRSEEGKEEEMKEVRAHPNHSPHRFASVRSTSANRSPKQPTRLLAPRPLSLAPSISLDALNSLLPAFTPPSHSSPTRTVWDNTPSHPPRAVRRSDSAETQRGSLHSATPTRPSNRGVSDGGLHPSTEASERLHVQQVDSNGDVERKVEQLALASAAVE